MTALVVKNLLNFHASTKSYLILKFTNVVNFYVHIRPIFSCRVTFCDGQLIRILYIVMQLAIAICTDLCLTKSYMSIAVHILCHDH